MTSPPRLPSFSSFVSGERSSGNLQTENRENVQGVRASFAQESSSRSSLPPLAQILPHSTSPYPSAISIFPAPSVYRRHPEAPRLLSSSAGITTPPLDNSSRVPATHEFSPAGNTSSPYSLPYHPARAIPIPESSSPGSTFSNNSSRVPSTHESISPGLLPSFASHERTDTSIANTSSQASPSPTFSASGLNYIHHPAVLHHRQPHPSLLSSYPASDSLPSSSREPSPSPRLSDYPYASLGGPISSPPYQTLPAPDFSASRLNPNRLAVEVNGCLYIRNAISHALVRDVVAAIDCGLPVVTKLKTLQTYATSIQADKVRDEFILKSRDAVQIFFEAIGQTVPEMPRASFVGSFTASDIRDDRQAPLYVINKRELNVHIALTPLSEMNGFYHILEGSHAHPVQTFSNDWTRKPIFLQEGDAIIWRGDLQHRPSSRGGGHWQKLVYDWGPVIVDPRE